MPKRARKAYSTAGKKPPKNLKNPVYSEMLGIWLSDPSKSGGHAGWDYPLGPTDVPRKKKVKKKAKKKVGKGKGRTQSAIDAQAAKVRRENIAAAKRLGVKDYTDFNLGGDKEKAARRRLAAAARKR